MYPEKYRFHAPLVSLLTYSLCDLRVFVVVRQSKSPPQRHEDHTKRHKGMLRQESIGWFDDAISLDCLASPFLTVPALLAKRSQSASFATFGRSWFITVTLAMGRTTSSARRSCASMSNRRRRRRSSFPATWNPALLQRIASRDDDRMPPAKTGKTLTAEQIDTLNTWVKQGAKWGRHWAFEKPVRPKLPEVKLATWPKNAIDRFILARLEKEGLKPSPEADKYTLARRVARSISPACRLSRNW